jgi:succinate dehydrogenase / fumarate reductase, cytochrome b subunit
MQKALTLLDTTVGKKAALAVSGLVLFGFVFGHMLGNLQVFLGPEVFNHYAEMLKGNIPLLWGVRSTLAFALVVHVAMMIQLYNRSLSARPVGYRVQKAVTSTYASATMKYTGPLLLAYIVFHILHLTAPGLALGDYEHSPTDAYANFVNGFSVPWVAIVYVVANIFLSMHLYHGSWSLLQSLGLSHPRYNVLRARIAQGVAMIITVGNVAMPLCVLFGVIE